MTDSPLNKQARKLLEQMGEEPGPYLPVMTLVLVTLQASEALAKIARPALPMATQLESMVADAARGPNRAAIQMLAPDEVQETSLQMAEQTLLQEIRQAKSPLEAGMILVERLMLNQAATLQPRED